MRIKSLLAVTGVLGLLTGASAQGGQSVPKSPADVVRSIRTIHIHSKTGLAKPEMLEGPLQKKKEFDDWGWVVMESGPSDLEIEIGYQPLTFYYTYRAVHPNSGMVIASGKLIALDGPDAGRKIANEVVSRVKKLRGPEQPEKAEAKTEKKS